MASARSGEVQKNKAHLKLLGCKFFCRAEVLAVLRQDVEVVARKVHVSEALFQPQGKLLEVEPSTAVDVEIQEDLLVFFPRSKERESKSPKVRKRKCAALQTIDHLQAGGRVAELT